MPTDIEIAQQQQLLETHRQAMAINLQKRAMFGPAHTPNDIIFGIKEARAAISKIKATLRDWNVPIVKIADFHPALCAQHMKVC